MSLPFDCAYTKLDLVSLNVLLGLFFYSGNRNHKQLYKSTNKIVEEQHYCRAFFVAFEIRFGILPY